MPLQDILYIYITYNNINLSAIYNQIECNTFEINTNAILEKLISVMSYLCILVTLANFDIGIYEVIIILFNCGLLE